MAEHCAGPLASVSGLISTLSYEADVIIFVLWGSK